MTSRLRENRTFAFLLLAAITTLALVAGMNTLTARQQPTLVRGNAPGEWRYWGADAWSTRYSPLDQINAANFASLRVAWQWSAAPFGPDEYYRTTPLYANGRLFTVATTRRIAAAIDPETGETLWMWRMDEGIRWQKAPRQFAGRGLAYWTDGNDERVIIVTPGYHLASLAAVLTQKKDYGGGATALEHAIAVCAGCATDQISKFYYSLASVREAKGDRAGAAAALDEYLRLAPYVTNADDVRRRIERLRSS